jgi:hypothetical protein
MRCSLVLNALLVQSYSLAIGNHLGTACWLSNEYFIWMLKKDRKPRPKSSSDLWFVYLLRCADGTLYTGIAKDMNRRCRQHNAGTASRYTRCRLPVELVYQEAHAMGREGRVLAC